MFERRLPFFICAIVIVMIIAPYLFAVQMNTVDTVFGGFLINPIDGHSYLAKMQQGFRGDWRFVLPYTAEAGNGAYLFLFYLGLGHLGRILGLPLLVVFHVFRLIGAILLLGVLFVFTDRLFEEKRLKNLAFVICVLGSGLGWLAIFAGMFTSDFWVAEAYPFLSMYTNPHFSIGLALMILAFMPDRIPSIFEELTLGLTLGIIQPFAVAIVVIVKVVKYLLDLVEDVKKDRGDRKVLKTGALFPLVAFASGGGLILVYQYWIIRTDPVLSLWNNQNITVSPNLIDLVISLSPVLILAGVGVGAAWQKEKGKILVIWALTSLLLIFVPWNLQRRFLTGIYVPLAVLAVYGLIDLDRHKRLPLRSAVIILIVLIIPTNIIILVSGIQAAVLTDEKIYHEREIYSGLDWINENTAPGDLILADEEVGLLVPSITGRRVIYGHPFETVNAEIETQFLREFMDNNQTDQFYEMNIAEREIDVIFLTNEVSDNLERWIAANGFTVDYENELVRIFLIGE